jgi:hypothetical protein
MSLSVHNRVFQYEDQRLGMMRMHGHRHSSSRGLQVCTESEVARFYKPLTGYRDAL